MQRDVATIRALIADEAGTSMVEYGLLIGLIGLVTAGALVSVGGQLSSVFAKISTCVASASC